MALSLGFRKERTRDCAWVADPALIDVPEAVKASWRTDGAAAHLKPYAKNGELTIITIRDLDADEERYMQRYLQGGQILMKNLAYECFALAARFKGMPEQQAMPDGSKVESMDRDSNGFLRLSKPFMNGLDDMHPGLVDFFGFLVLNESFPTEAEKKASSPPSTETPSPAAEGISPSTVDGQPEKGPAA